MACKTLLSMSPCIHSDLISNHLPNSLPHSSHAGDLLTPFSSRLSRLCLRALHRLFLLPEQTPPNVYTANSFTSFSSFLNRDLLSEVSPARYI